MRRPAATIIINAFLIATAILTILPLLWMLSASFMPSGEATVFPPRFLPSRPTITHYHELFSRIHFGRNFANSMIVAGAITMFSLLLNSMAGYAFAKLRFGGRDRLFAVLVAALVIPTQVGMLPLFLVLKSVHLINSYWGVILPSMATIFGIFLIRQFMLSIPDELLDAARVDGAGEFRIYWSIVMPLARPVLVTLAIFMFMSAWNDFMWPLIVLTDDAKYTLPVAVANLVGEHVQDTELMMASSVLTVLPVLLLFLALQRHYIAGIMAGSVKG
jgi:multiple sugar transport system permease protein